MNNRTYRFILGALLLTALYFKLHHLMWALIGMLLIEGLTNLRIPRLITALRQRTGTGALIMGEHALLPETACHRFDLESERIWRLLIGMVLFASYVFFPGQLWFLPWFLGFVILGAGVSGVCPGLSSLKGLGFK